MSWRPAKGHAGGRGLCVPCCAVCCRGAPRPASCRTQWALLRTRAHAASAAPLLARERWRPRWARHWRSKKRRAPAGFVRFSFEMSVCVCSNVFPFCRLFPPTPLSSAPLAPFTHSLHPHPPPPRLKNQTVTFSPPVPFFSFDLFDGAACCLLLRVLLPSPSSLKSQNMPPQPHTTAPPSPFLLPLLALTHTHNNKMIPRGFLAPRARRCHYATPRVAFLGPWRPAPFRGKPLLRARTHTPDTSQTQRGDNRLFFAR